MTARVATGIAADERVAAVKTGHGPDDVARLAHEASVLHAARHPDVVELIDFEPSGEATGARATLRTAFAGTHSLATIGPLGVERAAGLVAATASVIADLHEIGIVHGRIEPSHVLVGTEGRPVLCGFAGGGRPGQVPPRGPVRPAVLVDPACPPGSPLLPGTDVFGLGTLLRALLASPVDELEPIPDRRWGRARRSWPGFQRRALLNLSDQATADDPRHRPTARALAAAIGQSVPQATLTVEPAPKLDPVRRPRSGSRIVRGVGLGLGLMAVIAGVRQLAGGHGEPAPVGLAAATTDSPTTSAPTTTSAPATTDRLVPAPPTTHAAPAPPATAAPLCPANGGSVDIDGDRCPEPVLISGAIVDVAGIRYEVGRPGDEVAVGDWDCDGRATAAVVRPTTGEVFVFPSWAQAGEELTVLATAIIPGARQPRRDDLDGDGCAVLVVVDGGGNQVEVPL